MLSRHSAWNRNEEQDNEGSVFELILKNPRNKSHCTTAFIADNTRDKPGLYGRAKPPKCVPAQLVNTKWTARAEFRRWHTRKLSSALTIARDPMNQSSMSLNNHHTTGAENYTGKVFQRFEPQCSMPRSYCGSRILIGLFAQTMHISNTAICREIDCPNIIDWV